jgi:hypothetical protein
MTCVEVGSADAELEVKFEPDWLGEGPIATTRTSSDARGPAMEKEPEGVPVQFELYIFEAFNVACSKIEFAYTKWSVISKI